MSRQSLAVNSSGALTGTCPVATTSRRRHVMVMFERAAGPALGVLGLDLDRAAPGGSGWSRANLGAHEDEQVVLVAEVAVVDEAGEPAGGAAECVEHSARVAGHLGVDGDDVGSVAQRGGAELRHPDDVAGELPLAVGRGDPQLGVIDRRPTARRRSGARCSWPPRSRTVSCICASFSGIWAARSLAWDQSSSRLYSSHTSSSGVQSRMPGGRPGTQGSARAERRRHPAVVVDRAAAHDLEVLGAQPPRRVGSSKV